MGGVCVWASFEVFESGVQFRVWFSSHSCHPRTLAICAYTLEHTSRILAVLLRVGVQEDILEAFDDKLVVTRLT